MIMRALHPSQVIQPANYYRMTLLLAPEVAFCSKEGYRGFLNDVWSYGVCLYVYIFGVLPFDGDSELEIQINAKNNPLVFPKPIAKDLEVLLTALLNKNPENRPLAAEILSFDWFKSK